MAWVLQANSIYPYHGCGSCHRTSGRTKCRRCQSRPGYTRSTTVKRMRQHHSVRLSQQFGSSAKAYCRLCCTRSIQPYKETAEVSIWAFGTSSKHSVNGSTLAAASIYNREFLAVHIVTNFLQAAAIHTACPVDPAFASWVKLKVRPIRKD